MGIKDSQTLKMTRFYDGSRMPFQAAQLVSEGWHQMCIRLTRQ